MASFLKNDGDIILDAVLTDYGRKLLAKGDGSFNIVKFAFGDDEIDYGQFNSQASSIYQDIAIMNTPILEAFTNNAASMKHALLTLTTENILFMPVLKLNNTKIDGAYTGGSSTLFSGSFVVPVDSVLYKTSLSLTGSADNAVFDGVLTQNQNRKIVIEQGLDSSKLESTKSLVNVDPSLYESEYSIHVDNNLCYIGDTSGNPLTYLGVDDDGIATYKVSQQSNTTNTSFVKQIPTDETDTTSVITGTKGSRLEFFIYPSNNLLVSNYYFEKYGKDGVQLNPEDSSKTFKTIRMPVKIIGGTTGCTLDISVIFAKVNL